MRRIAALLAVAALGACGDGSSPGASDEPASLDGLSGSTEEYGTTTVDPGAWLITSTGIGGVELGMTLAEAGDALGASEFRFDPEFSAERSAACALQTGEELLCAITASAAGYRDSLVITAIVTRSPRFRTRKGVSPGTALADAAIVYGEALLSHATGGGAVSEFVEFDDHPADTIVFRPASPSSPGSLVGVYAQEDSLAGVVRTLDYLDDAVIDAIEVRS